MSTVKQYFDTTLIRGIDEGIGVPGVVQSMQGTPRDGSLELMTGTPGPVGRTGPAAPRFRWEGDIADPAALAAVAARLGRAHAGRAWRVLSTNMVAYWNGTSFENFADAFGGHGPDGESCTLTIGEVITGPVNSELEVSVAGTAPDLVLNLTVPQGVAGAKGPDGPPGPLRDAPDYLDGPHQDRVVPMWDAEVGKWAPRPHPGLRGPWSVVEGAAWDGGPGFAATQVDVGASPNTVAMLKVPAQDTAWRPMVTGGVPVSVKVGTSYETRVLAEVRVGGVDGQIVALGASLPFVADSYAAFQPHFATSAMTPDSTVGVIPAGTPVSLYVVLRKSGDDLANNYTYYMSGASIMCWARPVGAA